MGRYIPTSRSTTVARDTAMASQMAKDAPKNAVDDAGTRSEKASTGATNWLHHCPIIKL